MTYDELQARRPPPETMEWLRDQIKDAEAAALIQPVVTKARQPYVTTYLMEKSKAQDEALDRARHLRSIRAALRYSS